MPKCLFFYLQGEQGEPGAKGDRGMDGLPGLKVSLPEDLLTSYFILIHIIMLLDFYFNFLLLFIMFCVLLFFQGDKGEVGESGPQGETVGANERNHKFLFIFIC